MISSGLFDGDYAWTPPKVTTAGTTGQRPSIAAGTGPDPVTGTTIAQLTTGTGPVVIDPDATRIRYIRQSWDGRHLAHDSWQNPQRAEPIPAGPFWASLRLILTTSKARVGSLYEMVQPADSDVAVAGQSAVLVVEVEATR